MSSPDTTTDEVHEADDAAEPAVDDIRDGLVASLADALGDALLDLGGDPLRLLRSRHLRGAGGSFSRDFPSAASDLGEWCKNLKY